jgi:hypothetical protein
LEGNEHVDYFRRSRLRERVYQLLVFEGLDHSINQGNGGSRQLARGEARRIEGGGLMFGRIKSVCLHSLTIAWGYCLALLGVLMSGIDGISDALGDPALKDQISAAVGDARTTGRILLGISLVTIVARLRTLRKVN